MKDDTVKRATVAFVSVLPDYATDTFGKKDPKVNILGGAFDFTVEMGFQKEGEGTRVPVDDKVAQYEKEAQERRQQNMILVLVALGVIVIVVLLIFCYQSIYSRHAAEAYQKHIQRYK